MKQFLPLFAGISFLAAAPLTVLGHGGYLLPDAGYTPEDGLYHRAEVFFDQAGLFFSFGPARKAGRALSIAEKRLAETHELAPQNTEGALRAFGQYADMMRIAHNRAREADEAELYATVAARIQDYIPVLDEISEDIPASKKVPVDREKEYAIDDQTDLLTKLFSLDATEAVNIWLRAVENRMERAEEIARDQNYNVAVFREYEKYALFSAELYALANGTDAARQLAVTIRERALGHLLRFAVVGDQVGPQAKEQFERAFAAAEALSRGE